LRQLGCRDVTARSAQCWFVAEPGLIASLML
jgi:hypothetical protein